MEVKTDHLDKILDANSVFYDAEMVKEFFQTESFILSIKPRGVVKPKYLEEVQKVILWANQTGTPLIPVSSGVPHFRGDTVPSIPGAFIVDLRGMNRIIRISRRNRMAIIEPGVTYTQLQPELAKAGLRLPTSLLPRANKSVITNLLEREPTLIPRLQWSIMDPLRCVQVIWGDGVIMTTGDAGSNGTLEEEWAKGFSQLIPSGPQQTDFYKLLSAAQGSMGIATWASVRCEILSEIHNLFFVQSPNLEKLIDPTYKILRFRFGDELFILNNWNLASIIGKDPKQIKMLAEKLPPWILFIGIAGKDILPKDKVDYLQQDISVIIQQYGLKLLPALSELDGNELLKIILQPSREPYWKLGYKGDFQDIFFISTLEKAPEFVKTMYSVAEQQNYPSSEIGIYIQPVHQGASCHIEFCLPYNRNNQKELHQIKELYFIASQELLQQGAFFSRPYGIWANMAFNRDAQTTAILRKVKKIFDPNNIMNPGKLCF